MNSVDKKELFSRIQCALLHKLEVCDNCKRCEGKDGIEVRLNLIKELATALDIEMEDDKDE